MSVTTWTRIEPDILTGDPEKDLALGVAAEIADPLWLLGRQWQMGEWQGEDGGAPISTQLSATSYFLDSLTIGNKTIPYERSTVPTDTLVEHDGGSADITLRAMGGRSFLDLLTETSLSVYQNAAKSSFGLSGAQVRTTLDRVMVASSGVDGDLILAAVNSGKISELLHVSQGDAQKFSSAVKEWATWYGARAGSGANPAWQTDRLEYQFSMGATIKEGRVTLNAPEHHGGRIDWDTFAASLSSLGSSGTEPPPPPAVTSLTAVPALLQIPGMPSPWFWEVEDPSADAARIEAGPSDTARLLLIEAALAFAPDWFLLSLRLPVASLTKVDNLAITDTFGVTTIIKSAEEVRPDANWSLWKLTEADGRLGYLFLPPPNISFLLSEPIEEVAMMRDEAANLAWAVHRVPVGPFPAATLESGEGDLIYVPTTALPDDRLPLVLEELLEGRFLVEAQMVNRPVNTPTELMPSGFRIRDEELPDEGLNLRRRFELGRTPDGVLHLWISREATPGARIPAGGLRFDGLDPGQGNPNSA
jgi:hypothetical protein